MLKKVIVFGCWDLLHIGHLNFLTKAKSFGDELYVGVASDDAILEDKGEKPILSLKHRLGMVGALKPVTGAIAYHSLDFVNLIDRVVADVLVVSSDWGSAARHINAENLIQSRGGEVKIVPYTQEISSTMIKERIRAKVQSTSGE